MVLHQGSNPGGPQDIGGKQASFLLYYLSGPHFIMLVKLKIDIVIDTDRVWGRGKFTL